MERYRIIMAPPQILIFAFVAMFFLHCSMDVAGGFGSETTNGVTVSGVVVSKDGAPAANVDVFIRPESFLKDTSDFQIERVPDVVTNSTGGFIIDSVDTGSYLIEINYKRRDAVLVKCNMHTFIPGKVNLDTIQLQPSAGFYGIVDRENIPISENVYIQIYGIDRVRLVDTTGEFDFGGLPAGTHIIRVISSNPSHGILEADTVTVDPAENRDAGTFLLPFAFWRDTLAVRTILDSNGLTDISVSSVTSKVDGRIYELDLANRGIVVLPSIVSKLRLRLLRLQDNSLDSLPGSIGAISSLTYLSLLRNNLTELPGTIGNLTHLMHLNLGYNKLTYLPSTIPSLKKLGYLSVVHNRLHDVAPPIKIWLDTYSAESNWQELQDP